MNDPVSNDLIDLLSQCADTILKRADEDIYKQGAIKLKSKLEETKTKEFKTEHYPALDLLDGISKTPYTFNFFQLAQQLKWRPSPRTDYDAKVIALSNINEMLDLDDFLVGLMFMSPEQIYPEHKHTIQEMYFVLSGSALWFYGGEKGYRSKKAGDIIYNHPHDMHGIKTQNEAVLALYLLWGDKANNYSY